MFRQPLTPIAHSLPLSFLIAVLPIATVLLLLGVARRPAWQASLAGLAAGLAISIGVWRFPPSLAAAAVANGATFAAWPLMWIVFNAILLYNVAVASGSFGVLSNWILENLSDDRRVLLVVIGFSFSALLEGIAGFGTPVAIASSLLILAGFAPIDALVFSLMFNTAPVAFSALGVPITVLASVTHLPAPALAAMVGRQLPFLAFLLPFYVTAVYAGRRSVGAVWPVLLVTGGTFAAVQFLCSNFISYGLTDVLASLTSMAATLLFLRRWRPPPDPNFQLTRRQPSAPTDARQTWVAWMPWLVVSATVIAWTTAAVSKVGAANIPWPGLHERVSITLYGGKPYSALWSFQPLGTGTAILVATIVTARLAKLPLRELVACAGRTWRQIRFTVLTVMVMLALAYLMNYSGLNYTIGLAVSSLGLLFVVLSPFLGWLAVALSGADASGNALFGNLQVIAAEQLKLDPVLFAATNSSGGVLGKMISPQNIATGCSVTPYCKDEGAVFRRTFLHSIVLTAVLGVLVAAQQFLVPWMIPSHAQHGDRAGSNR